MISKHVQHFDKWQYFIPTGPGRVCTYFNDAFGYALFKRRCNIYNIVFKFNINNQQPQNKQSAAPPPYTLEIGKMSVPGTAATGSGTSKPPQKRWPTGLTIWVNRYFIIMFSKFSGPYHLLRFNFKLGSI